MISHDHQWSVTEAFAKFGFGDGDGCSHTNEVMDALEDVGYEVEDIQPGLHNTYIGFVRKDSTAIEFDGYELPAWGQLPRDFRAALTLLDPQVETDWKRGLE